METSSPTTYAEVQRWFWECLRDYVRAVGDRITPEEMIGLGYAKRELEDAHSSPSEKLLLRLLFLLFTQHAPTTPLFLQHREDINELLREPGLTALIGHLDDEEREEVRGDLERLGFVPA
jgi:hypothetical protein